MIAADRQRRDERGQLVASPLIPALDDVQRWHEVTIPASMKIRKRRRLNSEIYCLNLIPVGSEMIEFLPRFSGNPKRCPYLLRNRYERSKTTRFLM